MALRQAKGTEMRSLPGAEMGVSGGQGDFWVMETVFILMARVVSGPCTLAQTQDCAPKCTCCCL